MHLIIDGDIVAFRAASSAYEKRPDGTKFDLPEGIARARTEETMNQLMSQLHATSHSVWISGDNNFRFKLYPEYKANRKDQERPRWLEDCKEHLITGWGAEVTDGFEADDAMAMEATAKPGSILVSIDKDLRQIPGIHFNWVKQERVDIDELQALYNFYWHVLVGDSADNIKGCAGIGPVKATKALAQSDAPQDWFEIVRKHYNNDEAFLLNGQLIWLWRKENDVWRFPYADQDESGE
jgi:DNA polymerase-1